MDFALVIEILGFTVGLLYLWLEYNADNRLWLVGMVMPFISMWIYFNKGLYADFGINIYYLVIAVYGYIKWTKRGTVQVNDKKKSLPITHAPGSMIAACTGGAIVLWTLLYLVLNYLTDSTVPVADAFTTALSIVAMWMLAHKYIEQWIVWVAVDAVCVGLYIYKGIYFYAVLYFIYTIIACQGYRKWHRMMLSSLKNQEHSVDEDKSTSSRT